MAAKKTSKLDFGEGDVEYHFSSEDLDSNDLERLVNNLKSSEETRSAIARISSGGKGTVKLSDNRWYDITRKNEWNFELSAS